MGAVLTLLSMAKVMLVDDEVTMVQIVTEMLRGEGHEVFPYTSGEQAFAELEENEPELVITDLYLDKTGAQGMEMLRRARALNPPPIVIVVTGYGSIETAVEAMKKGAYDYLEKPFKLEELRLTVERALSYNDAISENVYLKKQLKKKYRFNQIIGTSGPMQQVYKMVERVADTDSTVLIRGESGTGKELVAKALHYNSRRQFSTFVPINCSALPEHLLESELFGHRKGAFTGAINDKQGLFQAADGGTIFLDEVGTMSAVLQSRLLRVLQEREVRPVGDNTPIHVNVRVLAATNEILEDRIKDGGFREDLYYRLNVITIDLPGLRERLDDIALLCSHFLKAKAAENSTRIPSISKRVMAVFSAHEWPGNVRELENAIERACALCDDGLIKVDDLPVVLIKLADESISDDEVGLAAPLDTTFTDKETLRTTGSITAPAPTGMNQPVRNLKEHIREQEQAYLQRAIAQSGGDKEQAAKQLGVSLATLYRKLAEVDEG
ncbi:MAG: two-component system response regulator AtoC [Limisphaerales bacterium]|jgi:two-component system response regulator AtoC